MASSLKAMNDAIRHRGPDDEGYFIVGTSAQHFAGPDTKAIIKSHLPQLNPESNIRLGMGFRRLAILDLSDAGHQPMSSEDGMITLTFNGEIYNYTSLRKELQLKGFVFKSQADTEVVLNGYRCWGKDVVHKLNGMFAIAVMDKSNNSLWLVRDRMGIKPLFYHISAQTITWASEIKALLKANWVKASVNQEGLISNFYLQTSAAPRTCFDDIYSLMPASWMEIDMSDLSTKHYTYWQVPIAEEQYKISIEDAKAELAARLKTAVELQLQSDVPLISMMSGGIDSTTITAMANNLDPTLACYSLGHDGSGNGMDELPQAVAMAKRLGIEQKIHIAKEEEVIDDLDAGLKHFEEPYIGPEVILSASQFIRREGYKVVLSGNGADEVFGGYAHIQGIPTWLKRRKANAIGGLIPAANPFLTKVKSYLGIDTSFQYYANSRMAMRPYQLREIFAKEASSTINQTLHSLQEDETRFRNEYEASFYYDLKYSVASHHVFRDDLSAMRYGLEMRYPFLDHTLIEWVAGLPLNLRYKPAVSKPLLRATATDYIGDVNLNMPKKGFNLPLTDWWRNDGPVKSYMHQHLASLKRRGIFNNKTIDNWIDHTHSFYELSKIWQLVTTEVWLQTYID